MTIKDIIEIWEAHTGIMIMIGIASIIFGYVAFGGSNLCSYMGFAVLGFSVGLDIGKQ